VLSWIRRLHPAHWRQRAVSLLFLMTLAGCVSSPETSPELTNESPPKALQKWSVVGKAAITHAEDTDTVNLTWERLDPSRDRVTLAGPFGAGLRGIERRSEAVFEYRDDTLQPLDLQQLSVAQSALLRTLPVAALGDALLRGQAPSGDWQVSVSEWTTAKHWRVPRKLTFQAAELTLQIVLLRWTLPEADG